MYKFIVLCDNCKKQIPGMFDEKRESLKEIKNQGGYAAVGIHLCPDCNDESIKRKILSIKKDMW